MINFKKLISKIVHVIISMTFKFEDLYFDIISVEERSY